MINKLIFITITVNNYNTFFCLTELKKYIYANITTNYFKHTETIFFAILFFIKSYTESGFSSHINLRNTLSF